MPHPSNYRCVHDGRNSMQRWLGALVLVGKTSRTWAFRAGAVANHSGQGLNDTLWISATWKDFWDLVGGCGNYIYTSSTAQGGGGSFKNRKPIGEVGCCESRMAERSHWWTERWLRSLFLSLSVSFSDHLPTYPPIYLCIHLSLSLSCSAVWCN